MFLIQLTTRIEAPRQRCFDLARDVAVHCRTASFTGERVIPPGRISGLLGLGDLVTFEAVHLGVRRRLSARVVEFDPPFRFVDEQVIGAFQSLRHTHEFVEEEGATVMVDRIEGQSPLGILGKLADALVVRRHLERFLARKQRHFKAIAEAPFPQLQREPLRC